MKIIVISSSILYLTLIAFFLYFYRMKIFCAYDTSCLRFCSTDTEEYSDKELFDSLIKNSLTHYYSAIEFDDVKIFRGPPDCSNELQSVKKFEDGIGEEGYYGRVFYNNKYFRIYEVKIEFL